MKDCFIFSQSADSDGSIQSKFKIVVRQIPCNGKCNNLY